MTQRIFLDELIIKAIYSSTIIFCTHKIISNRNLYLHDIRLSYSTHILKTSELFNLNYPKGSKTFKRKILISWKLSSRMSLLKILSPTKLRVANVGKAYVMPMILV